MDRRFQQPAKLIEETPMDLRKLTVFCKVYKLRSFSRAGEETYLSQPTVSSHIKYLEDLLEIRLFDRTGREVIPTKAAQILYEYAIEMIRLRDEAIQRLTEYHGKILGELIIGASTIPGGYLLPEILGPFNRKYPKVRVRMHIEDTQAIVQRIVEGRVEVGMVGAQVLEKNVEYHLFMNDRLILVGLPDHIKGIPKPLSPSDLVRFPFLMREPGSGTRLSIQDILGPADLSLNDLTVVAELGSTESIRQGIKAGLGVSIISDRAVIEDLIHGTLKVIPVRGLPILRNFYLTVHRNRSQSPVCKAFLAFCLSGISTKRGNGVEHGEDGISNCT